ncbi:hypothetical protein FRC11_011926 [Ceratobasidium sp. 423]|nr:hypothetical protein FRC11_011926 [Ceratobasidium sp. 423]
MSSDKVTPLSNMTEHNAFLAENPGKLIAIDFWAAWCGPCNFISPVFEGLAEDQNHANAVKFAKVDVDNASDIAQEYKISAMPTFVFLIDGKEAGRVVGADKTGLENAVQRFKAQARVPDQPKVE